jgi:DNA-binding FadR family transcriptional regulator
MEACGGDVPTLQGLAADFWSHLVDASDNLAYRLAYNSLRATYDQCRDLFTQVLAEEITDVARYRAIATAVRAQNAAVRETLAREPSDAAMASRAPPGSSISTVVAHDCAAAVVDTTRTVRSPP